MPTRLLLFCVVLFSLNSCEDSTTVFTPVIEGQYIAFEVSGQEQTLTNVANDYPNQLIVGALDDSLSYLLMTRESADGLYKIYVHAAEFVTKASSLRGYSTEGSVPALVMIHSSGSMSGGIYCPHLLDSEELRYAAELTLESVSPMGVARGTFKTTGSHVGASPLINGKFQVTVSITGDK